MTGSIDRARRFPRLLALLTLAVVSAVVTADQQPRTAPATPGAPPAQTLPAELTDREFWSLSAGLSEPNGYFRSENLVSNEHTFQYVIPALQQQSRPGGVYLGVAPDQNFTYIVATNPRMAFIVDIRRGNLLEHLLYKAIIELSADRTDFLSGLFSKKRPPGLGPASTVAELFNAFDRVPASEELYRQNVQRVTDHLVRGHGFALSKDDLDQLTSIYEAFFRDGPGIRYSTLPGAPGGGGAVRGAGGGFRGGIGRGGGNFPTYETLQLQTDWDGEARSYLAHEEYFRSLKALEEKNLVVPVVGNFAGPKALRGVGQYVRQHGSTIRAFYVSNVEQYLFQDQIFNDFARNVATLPVDASSTFIRSVSNRFGYTGLLLGPDGRASALDPIQSFVSDFRAGRIQSYYDLNRRSK